MARVSVTVPDAGVTGSDLGTLTAATADGIQFQYTRNTSLLVQNTNGASEDLTVTVQTNFATGGATLPNITYTVSPGEFLAVNPDSGVMIQDDGNVYVDFSGLTTVGEAKYAVWK